MRAHITHSYFTFIRSHKYIHTCISQRVVLPAALDLMQKMLQFYPADRVTVDEALSRPYLSDYHGHISEPCGEHSFNFDFERHEDHSAMTEEEVGQRSASYTIARHFFYMYVCLYVCNQYWCVLPVINNLKHIFASARFASVCTRRCYCIARSRRTERSHPRGHLRSS